MTTTPRLPDTPHAPCAHPDLTAGTAMPNLPLTQIRVDYIECPDCHAYVALVRQTELPAGMPDPTNLTDPHD